MARAPETPFRAQRHTLGTTALVNECYLRLAHNRQLTADDRNDFLAGASQTMTRALVDYARTRKRLKRGGDQTPVLPLEQAESWLSEREAEEVLSLDQAFDKLKSLDTRTARVVELRFFGGLSLNETSQVLGVSAETVQRNLGDCPRLAAQRNGVTDSGNRFLIPSNHH